MSDEHSADPVEFQVVTGSSPDGPFNRIVVYDWFSRADGRASPKGGNKVEILVDGEQAWGRVAEDLEGARKEVQIATWMCRPDIELRRPEQLAGGEPGARGHFRLGEMLESLAGNGAKIRLLIWGMVHTPVADHWMRRWYWRGRDNIDVLQQDHPSLVGSYHQKTLTIDGHIGYCGGMNLKENDWDSAEHRLFDLRRYPHHATSQQRKPTEIGTELPPFAPRHDLMIRAVGPVVGDLLDNFSQRWGESARARRASWRSRVWDGLRRLAGTVPTPTLGPAPQEHNNAGSHWVQIVRTVPGGEAGILGAYYRAIYNARRYIYIENQYFRSPLIGRALKQALQRNPRLRLVVVVWPIDDGEPNVLNPSGYWTAHTLELIRQVRPGFRLSRLIVSGKDVYGERRWLPVDVHAKVMLIDDVWLTIGSANINDRGFKTEGEINAVILDKGLSHDLRLRLMAEHLECATNDPRIQKVDDAFDLWDQHAHENPERRVHDHAPLSRVHHFVQHRSESPPFRLGSGLF